MRSGALRVVILIPVGSVGSAKHIRLRPVGAMISIGSYELSRISRFGAFKRVQYDHRRSIGSYELIRRSRFGR